MDRRQFIKTLFAGVVGASVVPEIETLIEATGNLTDDEFVTTITWYANLFVHNPSKTARITNIEEL